MGCSSSRQQKLEIPLFAPVKEKLTSQTSKVKTNDEITMKTRDLATQSKEIEQNEYIIREDLMRQRMPIEHTNEKNEIEQHLNTVQIKELPNEQVVNKTVQKNVHSGDKMVDSYNDNKVILSKNDKSVENTVTDSFTDMKPHVYSRGRNTDGELIKLDTNILSNIKPTTDSDEANTHDEMQPAELSVPSIKVVPLVPPSMDGEQKPSIIPIKTLNDTEHKGEEANSIEHKESKENTKDTSKTTQETSKNELQYFSLIELETVISQKEKPDDEDANKRAAEENDKLLNETENEQPAGNEENKTTSDANVKPDETTPLWKEICEKLVVAVVYKVKEAIAAMQDANWIEDGEPLRVTDETKNLLSAVMKAYSQLSANNAVHECVVEARQKVASILVESGTVSQICELNLKLCDNVPYREFSTKNSELHTIVHFSMHILANYADTSEEFAERIANTPRFLQLLYDIQKDYLDKCSKHDRTAGEEEQCNCSKCIASSGLTLIHNIATVESNIPLLRQHNFTELLLPYLKSTDKEDHLSALSILAAIVDEKESEIINSNRKVVKRLMKFLRRGMRTVERRFHGWSCKELATNKEDHLSALSILAAIVDEKESAIINSNRKIVKRLMKFLRRGMRTVERRFHGWSCKELATTIRTLARNDANKKLLVQLGALKLLVKLSKGNLEEQTEALGAIWALSFDDENRKMMVNDESLGVVARLSELKDSDNYKIKTAANGALWNLRDNLRQSTDTTFRGLERKISGGLQKAIDRNITTIDDSQGHIFISYQWSNQRALIDVRNELNKRGFKVWMDVDNMAGSTLQAMAEAVENADIVLVCFSQKYKNSPNCRAEAEYTFQRQKLMIPLRMEHDYKPDGWLGILVGTKLFYDFSGKYDFRDKLDQLLKEITSIKRKANNEIKLGGVPKRLEPLYHSIDRIDGPVVERSRDVFASATPIESIRGWTKDDIQNWKNKHELSQSEFESMTSDEIVLLIKMMNDAPESFYNGLQRKYNYDTLLISKLVKALEQISN